MIIEEELANFLGKNNVTNAPSVLETYAKDNSFVPSIKPQAVVKAKNVDEVQSLVKWANQNRTPIVPVSSGFPHFKGDSVPSVPNAIVLDLSGMDRIIRIDRRNRMAMIEPGVTFGQILPELAKKGLTISIPLLPRRNKSVITSFLEREPITIPRLAWSMYDPLRSLEVVWGNGDKLFTGEAGIYSSLEKQWKMGLAQVSANGPGQTDFAKLISGAQGSLAIVTLASVKCEILPQREKLLFASAEKFTDLIDFTYRLLKFRYGDNLLFLNKSNFVRIFGKTEGEIKSLQKDLPPWVLIVSIAGRAYLPEERIEFQEKDISDIARQFNVKIVPTLGKITSQRVSETISKTSGNPYWKIAQKGSCQDIFFLTTLDKTPNFVETFSTVAEAHGCSPSDFGIYIQPTQQGASCHCEFNIPYNPNNQEETTKVQQLYIAGSQAVFEKGAFFSRPYDLWADMVYKKDTQTANVLKKIKGIFDPQNVLNPGKLCF